MVSRTANELPVEIWLCVLEQGDFTPRTLAPLKSVSRNLNGAASHNALWQKWAPPAGLDDCYVQPQPIAAQQQQRRAWPVPSGIKTPRLRQALSWTWEIGHTQCTPQAMARYFKNSWPLLQTVVASKQPRSQTFRAPHRTPDALEQSFTARVGKMSAWQVKMLRDSWGPARPCLSLTWSLHLAEVNQFDVACALLQHDGTLFAHLQAPLRSCDTLLAAAVQTHAPALAYADASARDNLAMVREAVAAHGHALEFASPRLQDNLELICLAIVQQGSNIRFASANKRDDVHCATLALMHNHWLSPVLPHISERLQNDVATLQFAFAQKAISFYDLPTHLANHMSLASRARALQAGSSNSSLRTV